MWPPIALLTGLCAVAAGYPWADAAAALVVAVFVCLAGWRLGRRTIDTLERANVLQVQDLLLAQNLVTKEELERYLARLEDPSFLLAGIFLLAAWGRAPSR